MYESDRILACSVNDVHDVYLTGMVAAAMKQKVTYSYKIRIDKNTGDPLNSHCECPAGRGPHGTCKHIAAVCLMMEDFTHNGKIRVAKSATENLMSFNKPKSSYRGSPVKAEKLPSKRKYASDFFDDPRPQKYRNDGSFNDRVRNIVTIYCSKTSKDLSIRYLYSRADIQVDENQVEFIEIATRGQDKNPRWFQERMWRLTASRFSEICKSTCRRNTTKRCNSLLNSNLQSQAILHGKNYEKKALRQFETGYNVVTSECGLFVCMEHPFLGASPDAIVDKDAVVEIKCPFTGRNENVKPGPNFKYLMYDRNGNIVLKPSSNYFDQVQGQLYIANHSFCFFVVYTFCDLFVQKIYLGRSYVENSLLPKLRLSLKNISDHTLLPEFKTM
ncbi:uncharacterized protein LOC125680616 isoform X2 [Ostrea edulis]|nr:uncharacterized protein LOC125680616 isoform X2 [Ostrea edulis]